MLNRFRLTFPNVSQKLKIQNSFSVTPTMLAATSRAICLGERLLGSPTLSKASPPFSLTAMLIKKQLCLET